MANELQDVMDTFVIGELHMCMRKDDAKTVLSEGNQ